MLDRIICISIFSVFCLFGRIQLPAVAAVPFEYNEEHEQYPYDLETAQSQAKYDTRLLSQQLLKEQKPPSDSIEQQIKQQMHARNEEEKTESIDYEDDDLQPHERAASCHTRGHKYTHGQKVPRLDPCEVCLCMDGEIFCWWEKCEKRKFQKIPLTTETSTKHRTKFLYKSKSKVPLKKIIRPTKEIKLVQKVQQQITPFVEQNKQLNQKSVTSLKKKQIYQEQPKQAEFNQQVPKPKQQQQRKHTNYHHTSSSSSSSKIMNFPENLPSVLYYDYHTEEHEHHQHQHHQQHIKHQLQKKLQSQREHQYLKQMSSSSPLTTSPTLAYSSKNGIYENAASSAYDEALTDSDILPEPPTKKPKMTYATAAAAAAVGQTTPSTAFTTMDEVTPSHSLKDNGRQESNLDNNGDVDELTVGSRKWQQSILGTRRSYIGETLATSSIIARDDVVEINKNLNEYPQKTMMGQGTAQGNPMNIKNKYSNNNNDDTVETEEREEDDDAFHRWLTSTEAYNGNKNNNKSIYNHENMPTGNDDEQNSYATEISDFENPFGLQNLTLNALVGRKKNNDYNNNNNINNGGSNKVFYPKDQQSVQYAENGFLHDYGLYNGSIVNIDILLTTQDEQQQKQQQALKTEQLPKAPTSIMFAADLISKPSVKTLNDTKMAATQMGKLSPKGLLTKENSATQKTPTIVMPAATTTIESQPSLQFIEQHSKADKKDFSLMESDVGTSTTATTTISSAARQCNVMGTLYKIGDVLPQDTGNCLQCICIDGSTSDDTPRVTCSPHNCPPLVLPDLFDATGY